MYLMFFNAFNVRSVTISPHHNNFIEHHKVWNLVQTIQSNSQLSPSPICLMSFSLCDILTLKYWNTGNSRVMFENFEATSRQRNTESSSWNYETKILITIKINHHLSETTNFFMILKIVSWLKTLTLIIWTIISRILNLSQVFGSCWRFVED